MKSQRKKLYLKRRKTEEDKKASQKNLGKELDKNKSITEIKVLFEAKTQDIYSQKYIIRDTANSPEKPHTETKIIMGKCTDMRKHKIKLTNT